jgi:hypothetical protein
MCVQNRMTLLLSHNLDDADEEELCKPVTRVIIHPSNTEPASIYLTLINFRSALILHFRPLEMLECTTNQKRSPQ